VVVAVMGGEDPDHVLDPSTLPIRRLDVKGEKLSLARARNLAASNSDAEQFVFLDVDCIPGAGLVSSYRQALAHHGKAVCMGEVMYLPPREAEDPWDEATLRQVARPHPDRPVPKVAPFSITDRSDLFWSLSFAIGRETWRRLEGFDVSFDGYGGEDTDFAVRAEEAGVSFVWVRDAVAFHQHHATFDPPLQHFEDIVANSRLFYRRWGRWPMEGWLSKFTQRGLIEWQVDGDRLDVVRAPSQEEVEGALVSNEFGG
jgi:GT2 family glycosyltransferase